MKLYGYHNNDGKIEQAEIEVKEKIILVPTVEGKSMPFIYENNIGIEDIGTLLGWGNTIYYKSPSFELAKEKFIEKVRGDYVRSQQDFESKSSILEKLERQEEPNAN